MTFRVCFIVFLISVMPVSSASNLVDFNKTFSASVAEAFEKYSIPGGAYVIVKNNKVIAIETFGHTDKTKLQKINADTIFRLASVSKSFAATITTMLANEKLLSLSDPITKYVPHFTLAEEGAAEQIQLKHILNHSSGLMPNTYDNLLHENWSMDKIIGRFNRIIPICKPAECYGYQNIAYGFLQSAIEASQAKSYSTLLQEKVFSPLDMNTASVGIDIFLKQANTAKPHILKKHIKTNDTDADGNPINQYIWKKVKVEPDYYKVETAAGVNASITDLAKWLIANLGYKPTVLSATLLKELITPRIKTKKDLRRKYWKEHLTDAHYGYGWRIYQFKDIPIIYHSGWVSGFRADIGYSKDLDIGFAVFINAESNIISKISSDFWDQASEQISLFSEKQALNSAISEFKE
ncbi:MAG: beta-lactamase family protein [Gammaproteobacteria bacterium]|nr:beta-lactamase family protein [Gammaproteobacteria bacterium]